MNNSSANHDEAAALIEALCQDRMTAGEMERLEALVLADPAVRSLYVRYLHMHASLPLFVRDRNDGPEQSSDKAARLNEPGDLGSMKSADELEDLLATIDAIRPNAAPADTELPASTPFVGNRGQRRSKTSSPVFGFLRRVSRPLRRYRGDPRFALAMVWISTIVFAGVVAAVVAAITVMRRGPNLSGEQQIAEQGPVQPSVPSAPVARLNRVFDCVWSGEISSPSVGDDLMPGRKLVLKSGLAEIVFRSGAQAIVEGPAVFDVSSGSSGRLSRGKCAVTVENPSARGFVVDTRGMKYTDLGTEFGVLVAQTGEQEMHVFRGRVQAGVANERESGRVREGATASPPPLVLSAHEAIRVAAADAPGSQGKRIERIAANEKQFVRADQIASIAGQSQEFRRWKQFSDDLCQRPDLLAYYDFQPDESDSSILRNRAATGPRFDGRISAGVEWCDGRLTGKRALRFDKTKGGAAVDLSVELPQLTMAAWICFDSPSRYGALLNSTHLDRGGIDWAIHAKGQLFLHCYLDKSVSVESTPAFLAGMRDWHFVTSTYDSTTGMMAHYFDGKPLGNQQLKAGVAANPGKSTIGNFDHSSLRNIAPRDDRPLRGRIDELMMFRAALTPAEVKQMYDASGASEH